MGIACARLVRPSVRLHAWIASSADVMPYEGNQRKGMEGLEEIGACVLFLRF
jgi:hypothetical protein